MRRLLILLLIPLYSLSQPDYDFHGSFFIAGVGSDGIMVSADTRTSIAAPLNGISPGFFDSSRKIFTIQNNKVFAAMGTAKYGQLSLSGVISEFEHSVIEDIPVSKFLPLFVTYLRNNAERLRIRDSANGSKFMIAGYENGKATLAFWDINNDNFVNNDTIKNLIVPGRAMIFFRQYSNKLPCDSLGKIAEKAIYQYASDYKLAGIGGPIAIAHIYKTNEITWNYTPKYDYKTMLELYCAMFHGDVTITYASKEAKISHLEDLKKGMKVIEPYCPPRK